jgi:hypothetical protein
MRFLARAALVAAALMAAMQPAVPQQFFFFVGVTSAPPACSHSLNFAQTCNSANLDLL